MFPKSQLAKDELKKFFFTYPKIFFKRGELLIHPQETLHSCFLIATGLIRIFTITAEGKEVTITLLASSINNELVLGIGNFVDKYYVEALSDVEMIRVSQNDLVSFIEKIPTALVALYMMQIYILRALEAVIEVLKTGSAVESISLALYFLAANLGVKHKDGIAIEVKLTHQELANITGLTRETVTGQINALQKKGIVTIKKNVILIKDMDALDKNLIFKA